MKSLNGLNWAGGGWGTGVSFRKTFALQDRVEEGEIKQINKLSINIHFDLV